MRDWAEFDALRVIYLDLHQATYSWEPEACLLGNVKGSEVAQLLRYVFKKMEEDRGHLEYRDEVAKEEIEKTKPENMLHRLMLRDESGEVVDVHYRDPHYEGMPPQEETFWQNGEPMVSGLDSRYPAGPSQHSKYIYETNYRVRRSND